MVTRVRKVRGHSLSHEEAHAIVREELAAGEGWLERAKIRTEMKERALYRLAASVRAEGPLPQWTYMQRQLLWKLSQEGEPWRVIANALGYPVRECRRMLAYLARHAAATQRREEHRKNPYGYPEFPPLPREPDTYRAPHRRRYEGPLPPSPGELRAATEVRLAELRQAEGLPPLSATEVKRRIPDEALWELVSQDVEEE